MALALTQVVTEDRASGAQVIDGSLKFNGSSRFNKTFASASNQKTFTISFWVKNTTTTIGNVFVTGRTNLRLNTTNAAFIINAGYGSTNKFLTSNASFRDPSAWYHFVLAFDTTQSTESDRVKVWVNNQLQTYSSSSYPPQNQDLDYNSTEVSYIGAENTSEYLNGYLSQFYSIDGQALSPSYFGFTDGLTNTWKPKKYTGTFGTNGFYLPMDGNSPIGGDKSGNGNNWTPSGFVNLNTIEKATGALPILNTVSGGRVATVGVRTDSNSSNLVLALPLVGVSTDIHQIIKGSGSAKVITENGDVAATSTQSNFYGGSFTFDGTGDYLTTPANTDFDFGTGAYTIEMWLRTTQDSGWLFYNASDNTGMRLCIGINGTNSSNQGKLEFNEQVSNGDDYNRGTTRVDDGKWHHVAVCRGASGDTTKLYVDGNLEATGNANRNFDNDNLVYIGARESLTGNEFNGQLQDLRVYKGVAKYTSNFIPASTDPDILPDTPSGVAGGSALTKITDGSVSFDGTGDYLDVSESSGEFDFGTGDFTVEFFTNASSQGSYNDIIGTANNTSYLGSGNSGWIIRYDTSTDVWYFSYQSNNSWIFQNTFSAVASTNQWYHVAFTRSGTDLRCFVNGIQKGSTTTNSTDIISTENSLRIGGGAGSTSNLYNGFLSNVRVLKGTALYTSNFTPPTAPLTNVTNTKLLCCQSTTSATTAAVSPTSITANGDAVATNFNPFTTDIDAVRGQESGYCTLNPLTTGSYMTLSNGNLDALGNTSSDNGNTRTTFVVTSGKFYFETTLTANRNGTYPQIGIMREVDGNRPNNAAPQAGYTSGLIYGSHSIVYQADGTTYSNGSTSSYGNSFTNGDVVGIAYDGDNGAIYFSKNGTWQNSGDPTSGATKTGAALTWTDDRDYVFSIANYNSTATSCNFGQKPFKYAPPEGFKTLCLANLPRPTKAAVRPDKYFKAVSYTGDQNGQTINVGFEPSLIWGKQRNDTDRWFIADTVRGKKTTGYYLLSSHVNTADTNSAAPDGITDISSTGFTLGANSSNDDGGWSIEINQTSGPYMAYCWNAGGAAVSNTDGSITSSVSANQDAGFSIVTYTSPDDTADQTVGHGLAVKPSLIMVKNRDNTYNWDVYHSSLGYNASLILSSTNSTRSGAFGAEPTSTVFTTKTSYTHNGTQKYVAYCWSEVPGFSKFGRYTGNGNADGPFIYCGFKPAWIMTKKSNTSTIYTSWSIYDTTRDTYNVADLPLYANVSDQEGTNSQGTVESGHNVDILSNGFKLRDSNQIRNTSGDTYIFAAFAEAPTNNLFGGQANAR